MTGLKQSKKLKALEREAVIVAYDTSPLTAKDYAASKGIGYSTLAHWRHQAGLSLKKQKEQRHDSPPASSSNFSIKEDTMFMDLSPYFLGTPHSSLPVSTNISLEIAIPSGMTIKVTLKEDMQAARLIKGLL